MDIREIAVDTNTLQNDIDDMRRTLDRVRERSESMFQAIDILDDMWEGTSHEEVVRQNAGDRRKMRELCEVIEKMIECMRYADDEYMSCENAVHSIIKTIQI